jgi:hypothetical protein
LLKTDNNLVWKIVNRDGKINVLADSDDIHVSRGSSESVVAEETNVEIEGTGIVKTRLDISFANDKLLVVSFLKF